MGRVAEQVEAAVAHRAEHHGPQRHDPLVDDAAGGRVGAEAGSQFTPDALVRPLLGSVAGRALEIEATGVRTAGESRGQAAVVDRHAEGVRRHLGHDAEPGVLVLVGVEGELAGGDGSPADAVETVAAGDEVTGDGRGRTVGVAVAHRGTRLCFSTTMQSMPLRRRKLPSVSPATPAPTMATVVVLLFSAVSTMSCASLSAKGQPAVPQAHGRRRTESAACCHHCGLGGDRHQPGCGQGIPETRQRVGG
ncbi:hypothetical protein GZL_08306 [Streptomyces sp. 769]|nr:hypothetical protein GZL_08306 [Streptomyces sp. 769]